MPIYAYRCEACGFAKDVLQKVSDAPLTQCPSCDKATFKKQLTAAGFQLKGSGWYVTDFRGGSGGGSKPAASGETAGAGANDASDTPASAGSSAAAGSSGASDASGTAAATSTAAASEK
jgi:putative FmdB family regulatory protein